MKPYLIESELGRFTVMLSIHTTIGKKTNKRIKTAGYRRMICLHATKNSYRDTGKLFNEAYHRTGTKNELFYGTIAGDIEQEGALLIEYKRQLTRKILKEHGFDPDTGLYPGKELPEHLRNKPCEMIRFDIDTIMEAAPVGWSQKQSPPEQDNAEEELAEGQVPEGMTEMLDGKETEQFSEPDREEMQLKPHRRGERHEVEADRKESQCEGYIRWYNSVSKRQEYGITRSWAIEKDSSQVVYIMADVIYVNKQKETRKDTEGNESSKSRSKGEQNGTDDDLKRVPHMNINVESDNSRYEITSTDDDEAFKQLVAYILQNKLYTRQLVFIIDGEQKLIDKINKYCGSWEKTVYLDWMHLEHKCYDRLSNAIRGGKEPDPRGHKEYYKQKSKAGQIKKQDKIARSRLYARAIIRMLWVGNVDAAIHFLQHIDPKDISSGGKKELERLITYLTNKREWITCYALRRKAGLRNSSNGVEGENQHNVGNRQKHNQASWLPKGSGSLAAITSVFNNHEDADWFVSETLRFSFDIAPKDNVI